MLICLLFFHILLELAEILKQRKIVIVCVVEFTEWLRDTGVPDETLFASLNHSPQLGVPGAYKGEHT